MTERRPPHIPVQRVEDIPDFVNEDAEHEFWSTHYLTDEFFRTAPVPQESIVERTPRKRAANQTRPATGL